MDQTDTLDQDSPGSHAITTVNSELDILEPETSIDIQVKSLGVGRSNELNLRIKQNAELPVHSLPPELLLQVICLHMITEFGSLPKGYYRRLISLSGVCAHWYNVIRHSPPLWTWIHASDRSEVIEMALQRSSSHPLDIILRPPVPSDGLLWTVPASLQSIVNAIIPHSNRWRSLDIAVPSQWVAAVIADLGESPPTLEKLSFVDVDTIYCSQEYGLLGGKAPGLKSLKLNGVSVRWDSEILHDLAILDLSWIEFPSTEAILHALSHSPHLENLVVYRCSTLYLATPSSPSIHLPKLLRFEIDFDSPAATENFLQHIERGGRIIFG
ncbi:hypothetical protein FRC01_003176 [Tulasnella sp. 417]|nr:hypothetical protein FRC01_003176 [Tulasnella sp. 417]